MKVVWRTLIAYVCFPSEMDRLKINFNSFGTRIIYLYALYTAEHSYSSVQY
jgi:hypothetical protein